MGLFSFKSDRSDVDQPGLKMKVKLPGDSSVDVNLSEPALLKLAPWLAFWIVVLGLVGVFALVWFHPNLKSTSNSPEITQSQKK